MTNNSLHCPVCNSPLAKAGGAWYSKRKIQQYRCPKCRHTTTRPLDDKGNKIAAKDFNKETTD